jgi:hypothetical protein
VSASRDTAAAAGLRVTRGGEPTDEEVAAIVAAVEVAWPKAVVAGAPEPPMRWRFSGRWWSKPVPLRRIRPW